MNVENLLNAGAILENTSNFKPVTMESGIAVLKSVEPFTSKKGNYGAKITFADADDLENESAGHIEHLSVSDANRFMRVVRKLAYLAKYSDTPETWSTWNLGVELIKGADGNNIVFTTNEQLKELQSTYGQDVQGLFASDDKADKSRVLVKFTNKQATIDGFIAMMKNYLNNEYFLKVSMDGDFQRLEKIAQPEL